MDHQCWTNPKRDESQPNDAIYKIKRFPVHTADTTETMSDNKEQSVAALNTLINLALQVANTQQAQVQNAANVLAQALEIGPADDAEKEEDEGPTIVTTD